MLYAQGNVKVRPLVTVNNPVTPLCFQLPLPKNKHQNETKQKRVILWPKTNYACYRISSTKIKPIFVSGFKKSDQSMRGWEQLVQRIVMFVVVWRKGVHKVLVGKPDGKRPLGRPTRRWEDNIKLLATDFFFFKF